MLEIRFQLAGGGSAEVVIALGGERLSLGALDHSDALGDLASAVLQLVDGAGRAETTILDERREHLVTLQRRGHDGVVLEVFSADAPRDLVPGVPERLVLSGMCSFREVIQAMAACLDDLVLSHGITGYETLWPAHPFPREQRRRLLACARVGRRA